MNPELPSPQFRRPWMPLISFGLLRRRIEGQTTMERPDIQHKIPWKIQAILNLIKGSYDSSDLFEIGVFVLKNMTLLVPQCVLSLGYKLEINY